MPDGGADGFNIKETWHHLVRLRQALAELKEINEKGWKFLATSRYEFTPLRAMSEPLVMGSSEELRDSATQTRKLAEHVGDRRVKAALLEIADSYDRLGRKPLKESGTPRRMRGAAGRRG
jgi:hypothetical protein